MELEKIYQPIKKELIEVEQTLKDCLKGTRYSSILQINNYLLEAGGKKLRPILVLLSAKAASQSKAVKQNIIKIATAIELIHRASLIHDDIVDDSCLRHNKPTINSKWSDDVSIAFGDYLYSIAFKLISSCNDTDILECISSATKSMCEGELLQVLERDNFDLLRQRYIMIVKKKTAALFAASCQSGAMLVNNNRVIQNALRQYGLNFGIAFQIVDDCLDFIGHPKQLGKSPGADFRMGEITLPLLNLISQSKDKNQIISLIGQQRNPETFKKIKEKFVNSCAILKTKEHVSTYVLKAKRSLNRLDNSSFKESLFALADYVGEKL